MAEGAMSHGVTKLKELLFDSEAERLADLAARIDALTSQNKDLRDALRDRQAFEEGARAELARRIDSVFDRAGSNENLTRSVADILDNAFERAEADRHDALSTAVAPVVVKTVKTEILNSQDTLVEALYPMTGQMVKAYVASAMKDLINEVNRRLETNPVMLRLKSLTTGRSMAELALAESQRLQVEELLLIRRGTGELVGRWPEKPANNHDHVLGGVLTAINSFATEALHTEENALRQIDLGASQVYLRGSPAYLLAAKCAGTAGASIEQIIDDEFLKTVSSLHGDGDVHHLARSGLDQLGPRLGERISSQHAALDAPALGMSPVKLLALVIGVPLALWLAWSTYVSYETGRVRSAAIEVIETSPEIKGYPTTLMVAPRGQRMTISGLAPDESARAAVANRLASRLPQTVIDNQIAVVPQGARDATPEIAALRRQIAEINDEIPRITSRRALARAREALVQSSAHAKRLSALPATSRTKAGALVSGPIAQALEAITTVDTRLGAAPADAATAAQLTGLLDSRANALESALDEFAQTADLVESSSLQAPPRPPRKADNVTAYADSAERLADLSRRLQLMTVALVQAEITRAQIAKPQPAVVIPAPRPKDRLAAYVRDNAIFFADELDYRDAGDADAKIDILATLIKEAESFVRVVGYTDERGSASRNTTLSQRRADKVRDALVARGIPRQNLVAVGRLSQIDISPDTGSRSANRRVEFEIGFDGEGQQ